MILPWWLYRRAWSWRIAYWCDQVAFAWLCWTQRQRLKNAIAFIDAAAEHFDYAGRRDEMLPQERALLDSVSSESLEKLVRDTRRELRAVVSGEDGEA